MSLKLTEEDISFDESEIKSSASKKIISSSKKSVMFFTWSEDKCFASGTTGSTHNSSARALWGNPLLGNRSVKMSCTNCRQAIHSKVYFKPSWKSYLSTVLFSLMGCCCIPMYYKLYHEGQHFCPLCQIYLGHTGTECSWVRTRAVSRRVSSALLVPHRRQ